MRLALLALCAIASEAAAAPSPVRDWSPDYRLSASDLARWTAVGDVDWTAQGDEFVARPRPDGAGGWLIFDRPLQDVAAHLAFRCAAPCRAGVLLRTARTGEGGLTGELATFGSEPGRFDVIAADARGREVSRMALAPSDVQARFAVPPGGAPAGPAPSVPDVDNPLRPLFPPVTAPVIAVGGTPETAAASPASDMSPVAAALRYAPAGAARAAPGADAFRPGAWNDLDVYVDANLGRARLNGARAVSGVSIDDGRGFGPLALYVGPGSGEVRFKDIALKDLGRHVVPAERVSPHFRMQKLDDFSYAWSAAVADVNHDGVDDIVAGPYAYLGPDYTVRRELYVASTFSPGTQYAANMVTYARDFTGDGWPDVLVTEGRQMALLVNPRTELRRWDRYMVAPGNLSELTLLADLDGDGMPELLMVQDGRIAIAEVRKGDPTAPWPVFFVSEPGQASFHSFGVGDINGDGRKDIVQAKGWWEQPAGGLNAARWRFHPFTFGNPDHPGDAVEGGGEMAVVDVNGDGLADVISSVNAHGWGLAWYEQRRVGGEIGFVPHLIMGDHTRDNPGGLTVSQLHAGVQLVPSRNGEVAFVTGKKQWAHLDSHFDPDPEGPAYLILYRGVRDAKAPGGVRFTLEVLHNRSGAGSTLTVADLNRDGAADIVTSTVRGTFVFWGKPSHARRSKPAGRR